MLFVLQPLLFCLMISCTKQQPPITGNNPDTTISQNNNDTTMTDTTISSDTVATPNQDSSYSWLALGDSYTIGQSVNEEVRFPAQTIALLTNDSLLFPTLQYIAVTGWTTQNLLYGIEQQNPKGPFDVVSLLIGVNDQYQHLDQDGYSKRFEECLKKAIALAGNQKEHVFVLSIPDYSVTPFAAQMNREEISKEIDEFNAINKAITLSYKISYTDITGLTREAEKDPSLIAVDGLHPSGKEYAKWAALLAPQVKLVLK